MKVLNGICTLALLIGLAHGFVFESGISFQPNVNVTVVQGDSRFDYRVNTVTEILNMFTDVSMAVSSDIETNGGTTSGSFAAKGIIASAFVPGLLKYPPTVYVMFVNETGNVYVIGSASQFAVAASTAFVTKVLDRVEEIDSSGNIVKTVDLVSLNFTSSGIKVADESKGLKYVTYTAVSEGVTYAFTVAVSAVLGVLNNGGAIITPTSVETFFEVDNYQYANSANFLRLTVYLGHLSTDITLAANGTISTANVGSPEQIYVRLSGEVLVNGVAKNVIITGLNDNVPLSSVPSAYFRGQMIAHGGLSADVRKVTVDFPAGTTSFTYDPSIGFGDPSASTGTSGGGGGTGGGGGGAGADYSKSAASSFTVSFFSCLLAPLFAFLLAAL